VATELRDAPPSPPAPPSTPAVPSTPRERSAGGLRIERGLESLIFASRWLQAPLYAGLIIGTLLYAYKFWVELIHLMGEITHITEEALMLAVLGLVDVTMVANLIAMVVIGGYATFVSRLDLAAHPDRPDWLEHVSAGTLKIKLVSSLVSISGIHLLKSFINIENRTTHEVMWQVIVHVVFLVSAVLLSFSEKMLHSYEQH
jgi:uncharacterized protein (TIGR00645 family)